ncbi:MAG: histidine--tRNA ligase [Epulopiscium sp. Nuni2H_MBin001]|nr:MAG: histidine--tRNA ligase [Epulopiscium sp. Nuni2H_MBin001]
MGINALKGTKDIFGEDIRKLLFLESTIRNLCVDFGFNEIRTPIFELTHLFQRGVGDTTDIVQKEMYSFVDKGDNNITLKPESTAPVVRAYLEHSMAADVQPTKLYYISPTFRYERPEAGRQRQFHQFGVEMFGSESASADAEVISVGYTLLNRLGVGNVALHINSLGCSDCRAKYNEQLKAFLETKTDSLCTLCNERREKNPLRVLDCKNENCQVLFNDAPTTLDVLDEQCSTHFETLKALLTAMEIPFVVDPTIVRGLDYYTKTVFEFISTDISLGTICGGGRYDKLVEEIGGKPTPAVGFGAGIERFLMICNYDLPQPTRDIFIGYRGCMVEAFKLVNKLRQAGIGADSDHLARSVKAQMKYAYKLGSKYAGIIGESELESGELLLKDLQTGEQYKVSLNDVDDICRLIKKESP